LGEEGRSLRCARGHAFDRARAGHIDLLPPGHGRAGIPGDTKEMVRARARFLSAGHYRPLTDAIVEYVTAHLETADAAGRGGGRVNVLDVGCGEGSYGGSLVESLAETLRGGRECCLYGLDISRDALRVAARRYPAGVFFRNDVAARICLADGSVDVLLDSFAPRNAAEFARVLRPAGLVVAVVPTDAHLRELRTALPMLAIGADKLARTVAQLAPAFTLVRETVLEYAMILTPDEAVDLVRMTPSAHHIGEAQFGGLRPPREVTAGFRVLGFALASSASQA
jgi:23S rRNA (guanine745-N1)-methyltransferase